MSKGKLDIQSVIGKVKVVLSRFRRYSVVIFVVFVALLYGFVALKINSLGSAEPSSSDITSQVNAAQIPHIDQSVVKQLQSLQDNSVNVQALFNQARSNPFQ